MESFSPPRTSTSERDPPPPSHGLTAGFDSQIKTLQDSYLNFFLERKRIEEQYVEALQRLHRKARSIDQYLDVHVESTTTRSAWYEVRDNVEREAQTRAALIGSLTVDIINPLVALKETQERTRKRIREDLKDSIIAYNEYLDNNVPRLKSRYLRKYQEVEEQRKAIAAPAPPQSPPPNEPQGTPLTSVRSNPTSATKPTVTSPQPLRPLDRRPSGSTPNRNRSPSSSTAFSDLAHQGKKQLNQLIGFLDSKGGSVKETLGTRNESHSLRTVRAKREADEADKEYRKAVHWLETLRLRRAKTLEAGYNSLEVFIRDSSTTVKRILEKYLDNMTATTTTQTQLSSHCRAAVDRIDTEKDVTKMSSNFARQAVLATPDPVFYHHGGVGPCKDLIFGFSLVDYATAKGLQDGQIPKIVRICIREIDNRGLDVEGIYRVSGRLASVQALQCTIERDEKEFKFDPQHDDVFAVASLLKLYLRELPEPVFRFHLQDRIAHSEELAEHKANNFMLLRSKIRRMPPVHQAVLKALVEHLHRVASRSSKNKMDVKNLAIVFGAVIFGEDKLPEGQDLLSVQTWRDTLMEDLIENVQFLFDDNAVINSHPLPPTPIGEEAEVVSYGSQHTKVASVPVDMSGDDFTPELPPRPTDLYSLHPSSRANPPSPSKERFQVGPPPPLPTGKRQEEGFPSIPPPPSLPKRPDFDKPMPPSPAKSVASQQLGPIDQNHSEGNNSDDDPFVVVSPQAPPNKTHSRAGSFNGKPS